MFELIVGPMFAGKTEELIRRLRRAHHAKRHVVLFKPETDNRCEDACTSTHNGDRFPAEVMQTAREILDYVLTHQVDVVGIEEVQFFDDAIVEVILTLVYTHHKWVIAAGLNRDYRGKVFGPMGRLLHEAFEIYPQHAMCSICGQPAYHSQRIVPSEEQILVGDKDAYEARCTVHFDPNA
jgi:thymidine kinase